MLRILGEEKGAAIILLAFSISVVLGFAALAIDVGNMYLHKSRLANLADAAALAGTQDLPSDPQLAMDNARNYAALNGLEKDTIGVSISGNNRIIAVDATRKVPFFFAKVFDKTSASVAARAVATIGTITGTSGVVPFGIAKQQFNYGQIYDLKAGAGSGYNGNYRALALGCSGATIYKKNIKDGYKEALHIGDWVSTETGNMSGPTSEGVDYRMNLDPQATFQALEKSSPRILIVPIIDSLEVSGRSEVLIVGFAAFFLEGVGGEGNKNYVTGRFLEMVVLGDTGSGDTSYGLYGVSLIE